jgi:CheY-like chemotaxis protein
MNSQRTLQDKRKVWQILAVDDDPAILQLLERLLCPQYKVVSVCSGIEAVRLLKAQQFNIVIYNGARIIEVSG